MGASAKACDRNELMLIEAPVVAWALAYSASKDSPHFPGIQTAGATAGLTVAGYPPKPRAHGGESDPLDPAAIRRASRTGFVRPRTCRLEAVMEWAHSPVRRFHGRKTRATRVERRRVRAFHVPSRGRASGVGGRKRCNGERSRST